MVCSLYIFARLRLKDHGVQCRDPKLLASDVLKNYIKHRPKIMYNTIKWEKEMKTPVGTLLVIDPIHIYSVVAPFVYEVVKETEKSVEVAPLKEDGTYLNRENTKLIRKSSIVAILEKMEDFAPFKQMNEESKNLYDAYNENKSALDVRIKNIKSKLNSK